VILKRLTAETWLLKHKKLTKMEIVVLSAIFRAKKVCGQGCASKKYGIDKIVCVCNATYCDSVQPPEELLQPGYYLQYTSTQTGQRLVPTAKQFCNTGKFQKVPFILNLGTTYRVVIRFPFWFLYPDIQ
jgi:glucosylceramidase